MVIFLLDTKKCMNELLLCSSFDSFLFLEGEITTFNTFHIDGRLKKDFFRQIIDKDVCVPSREYALWKEQRSFCFSIIKGKRTPLSFRFILSLSEEHITQLLKQQTLPFTPLDIQGLYLNFKYSNNTLTCTTGTSMNLFTMDKSLENIWDKMAQNFFSKYEIPFEIL